MKIEIVKKSDGWIRVMGDVDVPGETLEVVFRERFGFFPPEDCVSAIWIENGTKILAVLMYPVAV